MTIDKLKSILSPPKLPCDIEGKEQWVQIEQELGMVLPKEYKEFITTYGTGVIDNFIWVFNPFSQNEYLRLQERSKIIGDAYLQSKQNSPQDFKHDVYPKKGGLFAWAVTDNGDEIYWLTKGSPDDWSIIIYGSRASDYAEYKKSVIDFLYEVLTKRLECKVFPEDFPSKSPTFSKVN